MTLRSETPCDLDGICPFSDDPTGRTCDYWCGADEPEDDPDEWEESECDT